MAGYADCEGILDADYVRTAAWRYRDYVIRAFNADKPYDRFLREQIAGDELTDYWTAYRTQGEPAAGVVEGLVATGFLRCASDTSRPDFVTIKNAPGYYYQTLDDTVKIVATATMGLTLQCAKCHRHKFDPIPQSDYYRMQAVFMSGVSPVAVGAAGAAAAARGDRGAGGRAKAHNAGSTRRSPTSRRPVERDPVELRRAPVRRAAGRAAGGDPRRRAGRLRHAPPTKRNEVQKYLVEKFEAELRPPAETLASLLAAESPASTRPSPDRSTASIAADEAKKPTFAEIRALYDLPGEPKTRSCAAATTSTPAPRCAGRPDRRWRRRSRSAGPRRRRTPRRAAGGWRSPSG